MICLLVLPAMPRPALVSSACRVEHGHVSSVSQSGRQAVTGIGEALVGLLSGEV